MVEKPTRPQTDQRWMLHGCGDRLEDVPDEDDHWAKRWGVAPCCTIRTMCILSLWCGNYYGQLTLNSIYHRKNSTKSFATIKGKTCRPFNSRGNVSFHIYKLKDPGILM